jgi:hypothetical protein
VAFGYAVYFAEPDRNRVIRWDPDQGTAQVVAGASPDPDQKLRKPYGLAVDGSGALLIADKLNSRIVRLVGGRLEALPLVDVDGHRDRLPESRASYRPKPPMAPTGLFSEPGGTFLAACFNDNTLYRVHPDGRLELVLGLSPSRAYHITEVRGNVPPAELAETPLNEPTGVVARGDGTIFLIERGYQIVREYHPDRGLRSLFPLGRRGDWMERSGVPAELSLSAYHPAYPGAVALDADDNLHLAEVAHRCVLAIDLDQGRVRRVVESRRGAGPGPGGIGALAFGPDGTAWVMDAGAGVIEAYEPTPRGAWNSLGVSLDEICGEPLALPEGGAQIAIGQ